MWEDTGPGLHAGPSELGLEQGHPEVRMQELIKA